jgi:hypothetical protein
LDKRSKVSIVGEQYNVLNMAGYFEHVDGKLDGDVSLELPAKALPLQGSNREFGPRGNNLWVSRVSLLTGSISLFAKPAADRPPSARPR